MCKLQVSINKSLLYINMLTYMSTKNYCERTYYIRLFCGVVVFLWIYWSFSPSALSNPSSDYRVSYNKNTEFMKLEKWKIQYDTYTVQCLNVLHSWPSGFILDKHEKALKREYIMSLLFQPCYTKFYTLKKVLFCRLLNDVIETRLKAPKKIYTVINRKFNLKCDLFHLWDRTFKKKMLSCKWNKLDIRCQNIQCNILYTLIKLILLTSSTAFIHWNW